MFSINLLFSHLEGMPEILIDNSFGHFLGFLKVSLLLKIVRTFS